MFKDIFEAPEAEVARLAEAPAGSTSHALSLLPVNILGPLDDLMIELPQKDNGAEHRIVVVPYQRYKDDEKQSTPFKRHRGWWACIVVASNHPSYPVGGHRLAISEAELVRGTLRTLELTGSVADTVS